MSLYFVEPICSRAHTWQLEKPEHLNREPTCHDEDPVQQKKKNSFIEANKFMYVPSLNCFFVTCNRKNFSYINITLVTRLKQLSMHVHILVTISTGNSESICYIRCSDSCIVTEVEAVVSRIFLALVTSLITKQTHTVGRS